MLRFHGRDNTFRVPIITVGGLVLLIRVTASVGCCVLGDGVGRMVRLGDGVGQMMCSGDGVGRMIRLGDGVS